MGDRRWRETDRLVGGEEERESSSIFLCFLTADTV